MRILILGGNGMIGHKIYQTLSSCFQDTWVLLRQPLKKFPHKNFFNSQKVIDRIDLSDFAVLQSELNKIDPDIIINAAGITIRRGVNLSVYKSILINAALPHLLEEWVSNKKGKRIIHFSTDCVFSGKSGEYNENSDLDAQDVYGKTKGIGELKGPNSLTLRCSMIGRELDYYTELLEWFLSQKGETIKGFSNVVYSGITTVKMAEFVKDIIVHYPDLSGVYNISSVPISKYELLKLFKDTFGYTIENEKDITYKSRKDLLSNNFFKETKFTIPVWRDLMIQLKEDSILNSEYYKTN